MKHLIYRYRRRLLAGLLLLTFVIAPFAVRAESLAEAIDRLTRELVTLSEILGMSSELTVEEQSDIVNQISRISNELTALQTTPPTPTTMEIIIDPVAEMTQAQFKDVNGTLVTADFYFSGPTTTNGYIAETVERAAQTFSLSTTTLAERVAIVPSFSGPEVFEPQTTTLTTTPTITTTPVVVPSRTNIHRVIVTGDAGSYDARAQIVYAPEPGYPDFATSTFDYNFTTIYDRWDLMFRLPELDRLTFSQLVADTGHRYSALRASSTVSFDRFDNQFEVQYFYTPSAGAGYDLSTMFGVYSVLEEARVIAGEDIFSVVLLSDQDEELSLTISPHYSGNDERGFTRVASRWDYNMTYSVHGVVLESDRNTNATREGIRTELLYALQGVGEEFGVTDEVVIDDLLPFMLEHTVIYQSDSLNESVFYIDRVREAAAACHSDAMESVIEVLAERYFATAYQTVDDTAEILELYAPLRFRDRDEGGWWDTCERVNNNFFFNL